jgi:hypothetical protein
MPLILGANSVTGGYEVDNSLRFNSGSSDYLSKTFGIAGNRQIFTISFWFKKVTTGVSNGILINGQNTGNDDFSIYNNTNDKIQIFSWNASSEQFTLSTTQVLRDVSAWYHMVVACDTTQATASNRVKLYLNGSQITSFDTANYPSLNANLNYNTTDPYWIGRSYGSTYNNKYLSEFYSIDGQALDPTSFGEFDSDSGIWKPIAYTGTYGTNGFYLEFKDSSALGDDTSGNGNDFTVNNLTSIDQTTDTPTNNFITMNPNNATLGGVTLSEGNLKASLNGNYQVFGTINVTSGKWYWEQKIISSDLFVSVADGNRATEDTGTGLLNRDYAWAYRSDGVKQHDSVTASYGDSFTTNDIIGVALDMDNGFIYFSKNGVFQNSGDPTSGATGTGAAYSGLNTDAAAPNGLTPCLGQYSGTQTTEWNFGSPPYAISSGNSDGNGYGNFEYAVPSGYYALNTKNLADYG